MSHKIEFIVNNQPVEVTVEPGMTLLEVLRGPLSLTGTKKGCGTGDCGACTVLLDGKPICSCLKLAVEVEGQQVLTIEGLAKGDELHPLQRAFIQVGGLQCGFCTPGMLMSSMALLQENPNPTEDEIRLALAGNLCRCTGYDKIVRAVQLAAAEVNHG
jgi:carbon-monoxide dehydrogenase small subunit